MKVRAPVINPGGRCVFVVDDDPVFNKLIFQVLKKYGIGVETFQTPELLLARMLQKTPDLCIVDLNLKTSVKGWDLIQSLREISNQLTPILITSTDTDTAVIIQAIEMGASDYLLKPLDRDVLASKLMRYFSTKELEFARKTVPNATSIDSNVTLDAELVEVDETGFKLLSKHLVTRGTALTLAGPEIEKMTGQDKPLPVTVVSASLDRALNTYVIYLEYDVANEALSRSIHAWLAN